MNQPLPHGRLDWLSEKEIDDCLNSISENSSIGYFLVFKLTLYIRVNYMIIIMIIH